MPYGNARIEIIDFWVNRGDEAIVEGTNPIVSLTDSPMLLGLQSIKTERKEMLSLPTWM